MSLLEKSLDCPLPRNDYDRIVMAHGGGGRLGAELLQKVFLPALGNDVLSRLEDQAVVPWPGGRLAFTTDSFVVRPLFFPGGDIGALAVNGTVNDLAVGGAQPLFLSAAFVLEEGLPIPVLERIVASMRDACRAAGVLLVTGDTKVVDKGKGDQVFITTAGVGAVPEGVSLSASHAVAGDAVLVSGTLGDHGVAVMSQREGLDFETRVRSDTAPLTELAALLRRAAPGLRLMRDPTRGGLAASLHEIARASGVGMRLEEARIPVRPEVQGACDMLGLDPLYVANEGKLVAVVPRDQAAAAVEAIQAHPLGRDAEVIGEVTPASPAPVLMRTRIGGERVIALLSGEQLPRIC